MEQEEKKIVQDLLSRFRTGKLDSNEKSTIFGWLARLNLTEKKPRKTTSEHQQQRSWTALEPKLFPKRKLSHPAPLLWPLTAVASLIAIIAIGSWFYTKDTGSPAPLSWQTYVTETGETKNIMLPDGSAVTLNSNSRFSVPESFGEKSRLIRMEGQVFFNVTHNPSKPFKVETETLTIEVLGTSFDVKDYKGDIDARIVVASGSVGVTWDQRGSDSSTVLKPGDQLRYRNSDMMATINTTDTAVASVWRQNRLSYRNEKLAVIAQDLERHFGIHIVFNNPALANQKFSLDVQHPQLQQIIEALRISGNIQHELQGQTLTLW